MSDDDNGNDPFGTVRVGLPIHPMLAILGSRLRADDPEVDMAFDADGLGMYVFGDPDEGSHYPNIVGIMVEPEIPMFSVGALVPRGERSEKYQALIDSLSQFVGDLPGAGEMIPAAAPDDASSLSGD